MKRSVALGAGLILVAAACSGSTTNETVRGPGTMKDHGIGQSGVPRPPDVVVHGGARTLRLRPHTFSWGSGSADGFPPVPPPDIGAPEHVTLDLPGGGWHVYVSFGSLRQPDSLGSPFSTQCGRRFSLERVTDTGRRFRIRPLGPAGSYDVDVTISSTDRGESRSAAFRWKTPVSGPANRPRSEVAVLADHDGRVDSYGVDFAASNLAETPTNASAAITVTAANGRSSEIALTRTVSACAMDGLVAFAGSKEAGLVAAKLGPKPFTYLVELTMDGVRYTAQAQWPRDEEPDNEPNVRLQFSRPLPAFVVER